MRCLPRKRSYCKGCNKDKFKHNAHRQEAGIKSADSGKFLCNSVINPDLYSYPVFQNKNTSAGKTYRDSLHFRYGRRFQPRVDIKNNDEIGVLGETVNKMVDGLYERFQLSKFVSSSTIESIRNKEDGVKESITLFFSDIRSFTAYSEKKTPDEVVENLNRILSFQTGIIHENCGDVDKYVGDEIVALFQARIKRLTPAEAPLRSRKNFQKRAGNSTMVLQLV